MFIAVEVKEGVSTVVNNNTISMSNSFIGIRRGGISYSDAEEQLKSSSLRCFRQLRLRVCAVLGTSAGREKPIRK
jgi:hypothetical protein